MNQNRLPLAVVLIVLFAWLFHGCSATSETTVTETKSVSVNVPEIKATVNPVIETVQIKKLPKPDQKPLIELGYGLNDSVEVTTAEAKTDSGNVKAVIYKSKHKKPLAVLNAKPKTPIGGTETHTIKNEVSKSVAQATLDFIREQRWFFVGAIIVILIVMYFVKKYF